MPELGLTEYLAIAVAIGFAISVPLTAYARFRFARDASNAANRGPLEDGRRAIVSRQLRTLLGLVALQSLLDVALIGAFAWILYLAVTAGGRDFLSTVLPVWRWVLLIAVVRVVLEFPIRGIIRRVRRLG